MRKLRTSLRMPDGTVIESEVDYRVLGAAMRASRALQAHRKPDPKDVYWLQLWLVEQAERFDHEHPPEEDLKQLSALRQRAGL